MKLLLFILSLLGFLQTASWSYIAFEESRFNAVLGWGIIALACMILSNFFGSQIENKQKH